MPAPDEPDRAARVRRDLRRGILLAAFAASGAVFIIVDSGSHSVSDTLYGLVVPEALVVLAAVAAWMLIGRAGTRHA